MNLDANALYALLDVIGGDEGSLVELIESFEVEGPKLLQQMNDAGAKSNLEDLKRAAHTMKSSARDFGTMELSRLCETLEHRCRAGDLPSVPALVDAIRPEFALTIDALIDFKAKCRAN
jgi:HPt (histidine-containing phosphotransfer) domain-containing protein